MREGKMYTASARTSVLALCLAVLAVVAIVGPREARGITVTGTGSSWSAGLFTAWAGDYKFVKDNVGFSFAASATTEAGLQSMGRGYMSYVVTPARNASTSTSTSDALNFYAIPAFATAMTAAVNSSLFANSSATVASNMIAFDRAALAALFAGDLYDWSDPRLVQLNPYVTLPPAGTNITLVLCNDTLGDADVLVRYLSAVSPALAAAIESNGNGFTSLPPFAHGRVRSACTVAEKRAALRQSGAWATSLVFVMLSELNSTGLAPMAFVNGSSRIVASPATITQAMTNAGTSTVSNSTNPITELINTGNGAWPLATLGVLLVQTQLSTADCSLIKELLTFVTWTQINDGAVATLSDMGAYAPLNTVLRKKMLDQLADVECNGEQALTTAYLVGEGPPVPTYESWATDYESASFRLKYYSSGSVGATSSLLADAVDFGVSASPLTAAQKLILPDVKLVPSLVFAVNFAYNIPELADTTTALLIDFQTASDIFLGKIASWRHENITKLNPDIADLLPDQPIIVVYNSVPQSLTYLYTLPLSLEIPEFKERVGASTLAHFPVVDEDPDRTIPCDSLPFLMTTMRDTPYAFSGTVSYFALTTPNVRQAAILNRSGNRVEALSDNILAAVANNQDPEALQIFFAPGNDSWPMVTYTAFMVKTESSTDCNKAKALVDWIYWSQSASAAYTIASANKVDVASRSSTLRARMLTVISNVTCDGAYVSSLHGCVHNGQICSDHGQCTSNKCACESDYTGTYCDSLRSDSSSDVLAPVLGSVLPAAFLLLLLIAGAIVLYVFLSSRRRGKGDDWEIDFEELELGDLLGEGGYGQVHKAMWKGSEVAVKMMAAETVTKAMIGSFTEEARTMSHLRHPNVVLFMAACTKPPRMCIVMEFMSLGSLFDLIHNDLIPDIPMALKVKIMFQAAKGMQFLHSSGIVHRDLKSLNLLLDAKWNVKVSDFGLTRFKSSLKAKPNGQAPGELAGSVPWMAPEVLEEQNDVEHSLADVYSFGVIMWEVLTREQPYAGMMPAQIAVAVIRNDLRPSIHSRLRVTEEQGAYVDLMSKCWHRDTAMRPVFLDVMKQLQAMIETMSTGSGIYTSTSGGSSSSGGSSHKPRLHYGDGSTDAQSSTHTGSTRSGDGSVSSGQQVKQHMGRGSVAPRRDVCFVVCDLARCNESWQANAAGTAKAIARYGKIVRDLSNNRDHSADVGEMGEQDAAKQRRDKHKTLMTAVSSEGYLFSRSSLHSGGTFMLAFADASKAASFALTLQSEVRARSWPNNVNIHSRVSLHHEAGVSGALSSDATRTGYDPKHFQEACKINVRCRPGGVICSAAFKSRLLSTSDSAGGGLARSLRWKPRGDDFYVSPQADGTPDLSSDDSAEESDAEEEAGWEEKWDQGMGLCSSNWCAWIINKDKITMGAKIGEGNFGRVVAGNYYGSPVAVKQLYKSRLDDTAMIKMRKEAAILSNLDHPHVVKLIGLSVGGDGTLMLVMEQVARGDLRRLLSDSSVKLTWQRKLAMLRDAALGLAFLHSQGIIHRDIKSSNLLVEKSLAVKVGDFGFATAKQDNGTQTRCGTPSWTAPEIISGLGKYTEKADVYSFGIVMWEVLTRKVPYADKNMMTVALDVINGQRPPVPADCPRAFAEVMQRCWTAKPEKRASMEDILLYLNAEAESSPV